MKNLFAIFILLALFACNQKETEVITYRPLHHFTPPQNWTNDPNGMVYLDGEYHFFYQYNPFGDKWGHMSWGHAVSTDLVTWEHLPLAIPEFKNEDSTTTMIFSGSAVVDSANTSGLFEKGFTKGMVAIYTAHIDSNGTGVEQYQSIAYSSDKGRTWKQYQDNPVLDIGLKDFRDPNVIWNKQRGSWLMSVVKPFDYTVQFYQSNNLKNWTLLSEFGKQGDTTKIWECPSLFEVPIEGSDKTKWALLVSSGHKTEGFVGMQYFIGDFDGTTFKVQPQSEILQLDAGKDFYAAIPFNNRPASQKNPVIMGWTNNWAYANDIPTVGFRGGFSFPRELTIMEKNGIYKLKNSPIVSKEIKTMELSQTQKEVSLDSPVFHIKITEQKEPFEVLLQQSENEFTKITIDNGELIFDRTKSGKTDFNKSFPSIDKMPIGKFENMDIYMDESIAEVFVNNGEFAMTQQVFPIKRKLKLKFNTL